MSLGVTLLAPDPAAKDPGRVGTAASANPPATPAGSPPKGTSGAAGGDSVELSPEAKALVAKLQARDADVHAHEEAHLAASGGLATSGANYTYERGPDGRLYAVGGEVSIDTSPVRGNPEATVTKALHIEAAARAPADPSAQDESVAAQAAAMAAQASAEVAAQTGNGATAGAGKGAGQSAQKTGGTEAAGGSTAASQTAETAGSAPSAPEGSRTGGVGVPAAGSAAVPASKAPVQPGYRPYGAAAAGGVNRTAAGSAVDLLG